MARNLSVQQFQQLMASVPKAVAAELEGSVQEQAESLAQTMRFVAPKGKDARRELVESIRVENGKHPLRKLVKAGGPLTTKTSNGKSYDYSLGMEFGNDQVPARPFFWPAYRLKKKSIRSAIQKKIKAAISKVVPLK